MLLVSGSGKLKLASIVKDPSVVGEKVEGLMPNIPKQLLLIPKPVGLGRPKGMANFGDKGAGNRDGMGATRGGGGGGRRAAASAAADEDFSLRLFPSASCTALSTSCCCCRAAALGDSNELNELAHTWSLGVKTGRGENDRGETGNGESFWTEFWGENPPPPPKGKELKPGGAAEDVAKLGKLEVAAVLCGCCWGIELVYAKVGRNGGGAILCNRETAGLVGTTGLGPGCCCCCCCWSSTRDPEPDEADEEEVPVSCCTRDLKPLGAVLYIWGAARSCCCCCCCCTIGRRIPLAILLEALFTAKGGGPPPPPLLPRLPSSTTFPVPLPETSIATGPDIPFPIWNSQAPLIRLPLASYSSSSSSGVSLKPLKSSNSPKIFHNNQFFFFFPFLFCGFLFSSPSPPKASTRLQSPQTFQNWTELLPSSYSKHQFFFNLSLSSHHSLDLAGTNNKTYPKQTSSRGDEKHLQSENQTQINHLHLLSSYSLALSLSLLSLPPSLLQTTVLSSEAKSSQRIASRLTSQSAYLWPESVCLLACATYAAHQAASTESSFSSRNQPHQTSSHNTQNKESDEIFGNWYHLLECNPPN